MLLALDISTSVIGISIFSNDYKLHEVSYVKFDKNEKSLFKKLDVFIEHMKQYDAIEFNEVGIEEPLQKFAGKFSNALTIQKLTQMNALISGFLYKKYNIEPEYFNVQSARKLAFPDLEIPKSHPNKKYLIWEACMKLYPHLNWKYTKTGKLDDTNFDICDSIVVGLAYIVSSIKTKKALNK